LGDRLLAQEEIDALLSLGQQQQQEKTEKEKADEDATEKFGPPELAEAPSEAPPEISPETPSVLGEEGAQVAASDLSPEPASPSCRRTSEKPWWSAIICRISFSTTAVLALKTFLVSSC